MSEEDILDIVGIGNAMVDVLSEVSDELLSKLDINKGSMTLISEGKARQIYSNLGPGIEISGGSVANSIVAVTSMGGKCAYMGKVSNDQLGNVFTHDIKSTGVAFDSRPMNINKIPTSHCMVMVTPDAQRTMCTSLGASTYMTPVDVDENLIKNAKITFLEGYLFDRDEAKNAFKKAVKIAHEAGRKIALTLSDPFCVDRHRDDFLNLIKDDIDILFANEKEILSLYNTNQFPEEFSQCNIVVVTKGERGSVIISEAERIEIPAEKVDRVIDVTGSGDLYAAGFLYGYTREKSLELCGRIGAAMGAEIISHMGARPQKKLSQILKDKNLI